MQKRTQECMRVEGVYVYVFFLISPHLNVTNRYLYCIHICCPQYLLPIPHFQSFYPENPPSVFPVPLSAASPLYSISLKGVRGQKMTRDDFRSRHMLFYNYKCESHRSRRGVLNGGRFLFFFFFFFFLNTRGCLSFQLDPQARLSTIWFWGSTFLSMCLFFFFWLGLVGVCVFILCSARSSSLMRWQTLNLLWRREKRKENQPLSHKRINMFNTGSYRKKNEREEDEKKKRPQQFPCMQANQFSPCALLNGEIVCYSPPWQILTIWLLPWREKRGGHTTRLLPSSFPMCTSVEEVGKRVFSPHFHLCVIWLVYYTQRWPLRGLHFMTDDGLDTTLSSGGRTGN